MTDQTAHAPTRPWPTDCVEQLAADASNHRDWKLCVLAVAQGQRSEDLLTRAPATNNATEQAKAALLKSFLMLTVHGSFRQSIADMTALNAYKHICSQAPHTSIYVVATTATVHALHTYPNTAAYIAAHRDRHDRLLSADPEHFLAKDPAYIADILTGLPNNNPHAHALHELYAYLPDNEKTTSVVNRLIAAVLRMPYTQKKKDVKSPQGPSTDAPRKRYGRRPGDPRVTDYNCMSCRMDNHKQGDPACGASKARKNGSATPTPAPSVSAIAADPDFIESVAGNIANLLRTTPDSNDSTNPTINNSQNYLSAPMLDSCATHHLVRSTRNLVNPIPTQTDVRLATKQRAIATAIGSTAIQGTKAPIALENTLCVPDLNKDLISAGRLSKDYDIILKGDSFFVCTPTPGTPPEVVARGKKLPNFTFQFDKPTLPSPSAPRTSALVDNALRRLHDAFAHAHPDALKRLIAKQPELRKMVDDKTGRSTCLPCADSKLKRAPHRNVQRGAMQPLEKISSDTAGPLTRSIRGNQYFTVLADQSTGYLSALPTRTKKAAGQRLVETIRELQRSAGYAVKRLHSDGAGELTKGVPLQYAKQNGIQVTKSLPNSPQMNGQAERAIHTLKSGIRANLAAARMPQHMWDYALQDCVAKLNAIPRPHASASPHQLLFGKPARLPLHMPFGAHGHVPNKERQLRSFDKRGVSVRYLAPTSSDTVALQRTDNRKTTEARGVDFVPVVDKPKETSNTASSMTTQKHPEAISAPLSLAETRQRRTTQKPVRFREEDATPSACAIAVSLSRPTLPPPVDPRSLRATRKSPHAQFSREWARAHDQFIDRSIDLGVWELTDPIQTDKPVPHLWAYRYKTAPDGGLQSVAARCTVRGDLMRAGVHYDASRTAAQTPSHTARRMLYARAALAGEKIRAADVPNAYMHAPSDPNHRLTMQQPRRSDGTFTAPGKVILIHRAQQGSPDGGYRWERYRNTSLENWGWTQLSAEPGCFIHVDRDTGQFVRLLADTDDFLLSSPYPSLLDKMYSQLQSEWNVVEQRPVEQHMGVAIERTAAGIKLSVRKHIESLLKDLGLEHAHPTPAPHDPRADLAARRDNEPQLTDTEKRRYNSAVGLLRFIVDTVVYDAAYIASHLARHLHDPAARHVIALERVARYLAGKRDSHLFYRRNGDSELRAFSDSDFAACPNTRRSRTGIAISYAGDLVFWRSILQKSVTLSTGEAEYMAASEASRVITWLQQLAKEWFIPIPSPTKVFVDNTAALAMTMANGPTTRSKHIDTRARYIQQQVQRQRILPTHISGTQQLADMFTKPLPLAMLRRNIERIRDTGIEAAPG